MEIKFFIYNLYLLLSGSDQLSSSEIFNAYQGGQVSLAPWTSFKILASILFSSGFMIRIGSVAIKGMRGENPGSLITTLYDLLKVAMIFAVINAIPWGSILGIK